MKATSTDKWDFIPGHIFNNTIDQMSVPQGFPKLKVILFGWLWFHLWRSIELKKFKKKKKSTFQAKKKHKNLKKFNFNEMRQEDETN